MIRNISLIIYALLLIGLAIGSIAISLANDEALVIALELMVDVTLIAGVVLYVKRLSFNWWRVLFIGAVLGECYLLATDRKLETQVFIIWVLVLLPALILNSSVAGLTQRSSRDRQNAPAP
jgi:hypothetical protein